MTRMDPRRTGAAAVTSNHRGREAAASPRSLAVPGIRLCIAIQSDPLRDRVRQVIGREPDLEIVGDCRDEQQVARMLGAEDPQLLLLDYEGYGPDALPLISRLRRKEPGIRTLVMSTGSTDEDAQQILRAGAWGLVARDDFEILLRAIRAVAGGQMWATRTATALAIEQLIGPVGHEEIHMTERELQVADGVTRGLRNKEIARELHISEGTVKSHLNSVFRKLGLKGRIALALDGRGRLKS
jgi:DNA-binding NarL/FixJ family response regulator